MPYYALFHLTVKDAETFEKYPPVATPTVMQYGGKLLAVAGPGMPEATVFQGTPQHAATALVEFESQAACERWYNSPEYRAVRGLRTSSTEGGVLGLPAFQPPAH